MTAMTPPSPSVAEPDGELPGWLFDDPLRTCDQSRRQQVAWGVTTAAMTAVHADFDSSLHRASGMTLFEFHFLMQLYETDAPGAQGELPMSEAARRVDSSLSRLSHVVRRLEERGWVTRRSSPRDARVSLVRLTDRGRARLEASGTAYSRSMDAMVLDQLDDQDLVDLARIMGKILAGRRPGHWLLGMPEVAAAVEG